tara:strand:+ start:2322 stop:2546 length:225 start_codon:yes stop_codon:yes gene_type:complete
MTYTLEDLERIEEAIAKLQTGERVVQVAHDGHVVKYAEVELSELITLRDRINLQVQSTVKRSKRRIQIISSKGI